ncbi:rhodanese-like domain-containing protein [Psychromonas sp. RZ22]|uniref:rhodanese-like domain-containing protein n=1 Tax=Psychromonas algarum TaxID=2555643 RepID=UPI001068889D|nr:rhodanese-like domain-containing protein [Psychromonas sp. RZ22]TEW53891.1 rhodanese-like domain-containing protein [Psychromonas sp. RZ22]
MILDGKGLVDSLRAQVNEVDCVTTAQCLQQQQQPLLFIDIREPKETAAGYPVGSQLVPRGVLEMQLTGLPLYQSLIKEIPSAAQLPIYLICRSGARSVLAAASLQQMGYQNVYSVAGGFIAWQAQGLPVQSE